MVQLGDCCNGPARSLCNSPARSLCKSPARSLCNSPARRLCNSLDCPNHIRRTKCSMKKRIIVRRSVRSMFGRTNIRPVKNGLYASGASYSPSKQSHRRIQPSIEVHFFPLRFAKRFHDPTKDLGR